MKKNMIYAVMVLILAGVQVVLADNSTPAATPQATTTPTVKHKHKASKKATPSVTASVTPQVTPSLTVTARKAGNTPMAKAMVAATPALHGAIASVKIYDRIGMPGDLRRALSLAVGTFNASSSKTSHTVFLALDRVSSNKDDQQRKKAYVRFTLEQMEWVGPKNSWIVLAGTVYDQQGGDCKVGDPIEVAVDFKDIRIDYDGTKLGQVQKGNDIAAQTYETLQSHMAYQLILEADDQVKDPKYQDDTAAYLVKARDGYAILDSMNFSRESSR